jgi:hypothetical protein
MTKTGTKEIAIEIEGDLGKRHNAVEPTENSYLS